MTEHEAAGTSRRSVDSPSRGRGIGRVILFVGIAFAIGASVFGLPPLLGKAGHAGTHPVADGDENKAASKNRVDVVHPEPGGCARTVELPGTVRAFDYANLLARVSGFLKLQTVDIGDSVTKGQLLAQLDVPELQEELQRCRAQQGLAQAQLKQKEAAIETALADAEVAATMVLQAEAEVGRATAAESFRGKQYNRMKDLRGMKAIDDRLVDEKQDEHESAISAREAAKAKVATARSQVIACNAKVVEARANHEEAKARVAVANADVEKSEVLIEFSKITSPYDGVITARTFHVGDFIQSADQGVRTPVLQVQKVDVMRLIVQMPDRDVPFTDVGDPIEFKVDGLGGELRHGKVSRVSHSEDERTRSMRTEVDLNNADRKIRDGMYGQVVVQLQPANPNAVHIPSACLVGKSKREGPKVFVCQNGILHLTPVKVGTDNGVVVEIIEGLTVDQEVVFAPSGDLVDGAAVEPVLKRSPARQ